MESDPWILLLNKGIILPLYLPFNSFEITFKHVFTILNLQGFGMECRRLRLKFFSF